jgi:hypothetical protein
MSLLVFMKACHPFDSHVIRFCSPGRKNDVLWIGTNQVGDVLEQSMRIENARGKRTKANLPRILRTLLRFPAICVCSAMWISILIRQVGEHGIQHAGVYRGSRLDVVREPQLSNMM